MLAINCSVGVNTTFDINVLDTVLGVQKYLLKNKLVFCYEQTLGSSEQDGGHRSPEVMLADKRSDLPISEVSAK